MDPMIAPIRPLVLLDKTTINIKGNLDRRREKVKAGLIREPEAEQN